MKSRIGVLLCGLVVSGSSFALSGKEYLEQCSLEKLKSLDKPAYDLAITYCTAMVRGVVDGHNITASYYEKPRFYCIPQGKTYMDLTGEIVGQLMVETKFIEKDFAGLALVYLGRSFPCDKKQ